jgi:hypothetical protein
MSSTQLVKCFVVFIPFFFLAICSGSIYGDLLTNDVPDTIPAVKMTKAGQGITAAIVSGFYQFYEEGGVCYLYIYIFIKKIKKKDCMF